MREDDELVQMPGFEGMGNDHGAGGMPEAEGGDAGEMPGVDAMDAEEDDARMPGVDDDDSGGMPGLGAMPSDSEIEMPEGVGMGASGSAGGEDATSDPLRPDEYSEWFRSSDDVRTGVVEGNLFAQKPVEYSVVDGMAIFEGDIALGRADELAQTPELDMADRPISGIAEGVGITGQQYRWPNGMVPLVIDPNLPNQQRVTDAIAHWHQKTAIRLIPRTNQTNFVRFTDRGGCWSSVGMRGRQQDISLGAGCGFGAAVHEIGHAVGLWHEQSREDRDRNVRINWQNIQSGREHNFNQHVTDGDDIGGYDFGSIMHYGPTAFSKNGQPTIVPLGGQSIGQRGGLSAGDIAAVRALYPNVRRVAWHNWEDLGGVIIGAPTVSS